MGTHVRRPSPGPFASNGRRMGGEGRAPMPGSNRDALKGMGEFILGQVRLGASEQQWADWLKTPFEHACIASDMSTVRRLLEAGVNGPYDRPRDPRIKRHTLLHVASTIGNIEVVETLLRWGSLADVAAREPGEKAYTPLHRAALNGHAEVARVLIKAGADKDARTGGSVATPLHLAARKGHEVCVRTLLLTGADRNARRGLDGATPLHQAAFFGQVGAVRALLQGVANPNSQDAEGCTPIFLAAQEGHQEVVLDLLANGASPDIPREDGWTPLHAAARFGHATTASSLVTEGHADIDATTGDHGSTPLHVAAISGFDEVLTVLMDVGSDLEGSDSGGWTPLHCACAAARASCVNALIARGADPTAITPDGQRPAALIGTDLAEGEQPNSETNESIWRMLRVPRAEFEARRRRHTAKVGRAPPPYNDSGKVVTESSPDPQAAEQTEHKGQTEHEAGSPRLAPAYGQEAVGGPYDSQGSGSGTASVSGSFSGSGKSGSRPQQHRSPTPRGPLPGAGGGMAALLSKDGRPPAVSSQGVQPRLGPSQSQSTKGPVLNEGGGGGAAKPNLPLETSGAGPRDEAADSTVSETSPEEARVAVMAKHQDGMGSGDAPESGSGAGCESPIKRPSAHDASISIGGVVGPPKLTYGSSEASSSPSAPSGTSLAVQSVVAGNVGVAAASTKSSVRLSPRSISSARGGDAPDADLRSPSGEGAGARAISTPPSGTSSKKSGKPLRRRPSRGDLEAEKSAPSDLPEECPGGAAVGSVNRSRSVSPSAKRVERDRSSKLEQTKEDRERRSFKPILERRVTSVEDDVPRGLFAASRSIVKEGVPGGGEGVRVMMLRPAPATSASTSSSLSPRSGDKNSLDKNTLDKASSDRGNGQTGSGFLAERGVPRVEDTLEVKRSMSQRLGSAGGSYDQLTGRKRTGKLVAERIAAFDPFSFSKKDDVMMRGARGPGSNRSR